MGKNETSGYGNPPNFQPTHLHSDEALLVDNYDKNDFPPSNPQILWHIFSKLASLK